MGAPAASVVGASILIGRLGRTFSRGSIGRFVDEAWLVNDRTQRAHPVTGRVGMFHRFIRVTDVDTHTFVTRDRHVESNRVVRYFCVQGWCFHVASGKR